MTSKREARAPSRDRGFVTAAVVGAAITIQGLAAGLPGPVVVAGAATSVSAAGVAVAHRVGRIVRLRGALTALQSENAALTERLVRVTATRDRLIETFFHPAAQPEVHGVAFRRGRTRDRGTSPNERPQHLRAVR